MTLVVVQSPIPMHVDTILPPCRLSTSIIKTPILALHVPRMSHPTMRWMPPPGLLPPSRLARPTPCTRTIVQVRYSDNASRSARLTCCSPLVIPSASASRSPLPSPHSSATMSSHSPSSEYAPRPLQHHHHHHYEHDMASRHQYTPPAGESWTMLTCGVQPMRVCRLASGRTSVSSTRRSAFNTYASTPSHIFAVSAPALPGTCARAWLSFRTLCNPGRRICSDGAPRCSQEANGAE